MLQKLNDIHSKISTICQTKQGNEYWPNESIWMDEQGVKPSVRTTSHCPKYEEIRR
jgi:hypothetical protein